MELYKHLQKKQQDGKVIRNGLVGCGQMGSGLLHVTKKMQGLETYAISDINIQRVINELKSLGVQESDIITTNKKSAAEDALIAGKYLVTEDALLLPQLENLDAVIEATGMTEIGAKVAWTAINNKKIMVMLNVETDVTVGVLLDRVARNAGSIYTVSAGDEPAVCKMLYDFASTMGFEVVCLGKGKNNPLEINATPESCYEEAIGRGMNPKMLASFKDGTKTMVEMAAVSNATGLLPDIPGMYGPKVELNELRNVFIPKQEGGIFSKKGCVDYSTGSIAPGVFAIVTTDDSRIRADMKFMAMGPGPYYLLFRPFHLCNVETPIAVAEAVIYNEPTVTAKTMHSEVVAMAKRDLKAGEKVGEIGGKDFYNSIYTYEKARTNKAIPMGIAPNGSVLKDIKKGDMLTEDNFSPDQTTFVYKLRKMQDAMFENMRA